MDNTKEALSLEHNQLHDEMKRHSLFYNLISPTPYRYIRVYKYVPVVAWTIAGDREHSEKRRL